MKYLIFLSYLFWTPLLLAQPIAIAIHGGAGTILRSELSPEKEQAIRADLKQALDQGYRILENNGSSIDAVLAAIKVLENSPFFNAGKGAVYTYDGHHELDASIMTGHNLAAGAVAGVRRIQHPIELARLVMDKSVHVLLTGSGAEDFAQQQGIPLVNNSFFNTEFRYQALLKAKQKISLQQPLVTNEKVGTVGAVALDKQGHLSAGTSTGGMTAKRFGRIGDSPIIGAGTYADDSSCAVSATGHGEYFIRYHVAADICARVKYQNKSIQAAGIEVIHQVLTPVGGTGGVIIIDPQGHVATPFNTPGMYRGYRKNNQAPIINIFK